MKPRCMDCAFWQPFDYANAKNIPKRHERNGECYRFPPQVALSPLSNQHPIMYDVATNYRPQVAATDWCGEFKVDTVEHPG